MFVGIYHMANGNSDIGCMSFVIMFCRLRDDGKSASSVSGNQPEILSSSLWFVL